MLANIYKDGLDKSSQLIRFTCRASALVKITHWLQEHASWICCFSSANCGHTTVYSLDEWYSLFVSDNLKMSSRKLKHGLTALILEGNIFPASQTMFHVVITRCKQQSLQLKNRKNLKSSAFGIEKHLSRTKSHNQPDIPVSGNQMIHSASKCVSVPCEDISMARKLFLLYFIAQKLMHARHPSVKHV